MKNSFKLEFLLCFCLILFLCGKTKKNPEGKDSVIDNVSRVSLLFDIYNHTQGFLKSIKITAFQGEILKLDISQFEVNGVDERRIVIRKDRLGPLVAYSRLGECELVAPERNSFYTIYLMNASHEADYRVVDVRVGLYEGNLQFPRKMNWFKENRNGYKGPYLPLNGAIEDLNMALDFTWATYGQFFQVTNKKGTHFSVGYGY